jgi:hypothetical protein
MKLRSAVVRTKLKEKEEPEETLLTSAGTHVLPVTPVLKDNSTSRDLQQIKSSAFAGDFFYHRLAGCKWIIINFKNKGMPATGQHLAIFIPYFKRYLSCQPS